MKTIYFREIKALFNSYYGWAFTALLLLGGGIIFAVSNLAEGSARISPVILGLQYVLLIITPLLTFRLFSISKSFGQGKKGADRTLLSSPVSSLRIAAGKFFSVFSVLLIALAVSLVYPLILSAFGSPSWGETLSAYLGLLLYGGMLLSIGVFVSALFCDRKTASTVTLAAMLGILLAEAIAPEISNMLISGVLFNAIPSYHLYYFVSGIVYFPSIVYFLSITALFVFLAGKAVEHRKRLG